MATIRRSGSGWQALIKKKEYLGPKAKTFRSKAQAQLWTNAVEGSLKRPVQLDQAPSQLLKEAIDLFIEVALQEQWPIAGSVEFNSANIRSSILLCGVMNAFSPLWFTLRRYQVIH